MTATTGDNTVDARFRHLAVFYETGQDYLDQVGGFVRRGLAAREPVLVAVPAARLRMLRRALDEAVDAVTFTDMQDLGRNPARVIPAIRRPYRVVRPGTCSANVVLAHPPFPQTNRRTCRSMSTSRPPLAVSASCRW